ncbi:hypothetical protein KC352_g14856 [Hortaea werneckii]|nr:hypothetical protein KC352_g14856 [Hortaea werneckii]
MAPGYRAHPPPAAPMHPMHFQQAQQSGVPPPNLRQTPDRRRTRRTSSPDPLQTEPSSVQPLNKASSLTGQHESYSNSTAARHDGPPTATTNWSPPWTSLDTPQPGGQADGSSSVAAGDHNAYEKSLYVIPTENVAALCLHTKQWLLDQFRNPELSAPNILRVDSQNLHELPWMSRGHLVVVEDSIYLDHHPEILGSILAVSVPKDPNLRLFYTILPIGPLLRHLRQNNCLNKTAKSIPSHSKHHARLFHFLTQTFLTSITPPHHPDYIAAQQITDYCPSILDPSTAFSRLESNETLYFATAGVSEPLDLSQDRYTHTLHPAESSLAADLKLACSAYLLLKRKFFQAFWKECVAHKGRISGTAEGGSRVRSEHAHEVWLVEETKWKYGDL